MSFYSFYKWNDNDGTHVWLLKDGTVHNTRGNDSSQQEQHAVSNEQQSSNERLKAKQ